MAEFSSPILGGIRVARSTVSSSVFGGNPRAAASSGPDPQTIGILSRNELALTSLSNQLSGMAQQMAALSGSIQQIGVAIANDSALERQRDIQKQNQERILSEQKLREGKESTIERKMQSALISPVQKIAAKAQFTLAKVGNFFMMLLGGWIANQSLLTINALATGNKKLLDQVKNNVVQNVGVIVGILSVVNRSLFGIITASSRITSKIFSGVVKGLFVRPVTALVNAVKSAGKGLLGLGKGAAAEGATAAATRSVAGGESRGLVGGLMEGAGGMLKGVAGAIGKRALPFGVGAAIDIAGGEDPARAAAGAAAGTTGAEVGAILGAPLGPLGIFGGSILGYTLAEPLGKSLYNNATGKTPKAATTPAAAKSPPASNLKMGSGKPESQDFSQPAQYGTINIAPVSGESGADSQAEGVTPQGQPADYSSVFSGSQAQIQPFKPQESQQKMQSVGPLPEPQPTVVMAPTPPAPVQSAPSGGGGPANNVPAIPSGNPDNFYVLYSQAHYNVVM
jgi:hypothetical protein